MTLLLAVLFLTASLSISLGIFYIVFVQLQINRAARESHKAFYAANTAKECVLYYQNYVGEPSDYGFWDIANPCDGPLDGSGCIDNAKIPVCFDEQVYKTSSIRVSPPTNIRGVDYNAPGDAALPPGPNVEGPDHIFKFTIKKDETCADVTVTTRRRMIAGFPQTRIITVADGFSSCDTRTAVNRSVQACISSDPADNCQ